MKTIEVRDEVRAVLGGDRVDDGCAKACVDAVKRLSTRNTGLDRSAVLGHARVPARVLGEGDCELATGDARDIAMADSRFADLEGHEPLQKS